MNTIVRCPVTGRACSEGTCRERHWCHRMLERGLSRTGLPLKRKFRPRLEDGLLKLGADSVHGFERIVLEDFFADFIPEIFLRIEFGRIATGEIMRLN